MRDSKEKRERFLGDLADLCEELPDPESESLLVQLHFECADSLGIPVGGFLASLFAGFVALFFMLPTLGVITGDGLSPVEAKRLSIGLVGVVGTIGALATIIGRRRTLQTNHYLRGVLEELLLLHTFLDNYLVDLEQKYPPIILASVTTTKIMHYFMLVQLREALTPLTREIRVLLNQRSYSATRHALELLHGALSLSPSASQAADHSLEVPIYNIPKVLDALTIHLQDLLQQLEAGVRQRPLSDGPQRDL